MSPKELQYIEDALGHEQFCITQCQDAVQNLQDGSLKQYAQEMCSKHQQTFQQLFQLV